MCKDFKSLINLKTHNHQKFQPLIVRHSLSINIKGCNFSFVSFLDTSSSSSCFPLAFLIFTVLAFEKYSDKNLSIICSKMVINSRGSELSHCLARLLNEKENNLSLMASSVAPLSVSHISRKFATWALGSLSSNPSN